MTATTAAAAVHDGVSAATARLASLILNEHSLPDVLGLVATLGRDILGGCGAAGCTLLARDRPVSSAFTDARLQPCEQRWFAANAGPGPAAVTTRTLVLSADPLADCPQLAFPADRPVSVAAAPLLVEDEVVAILTLYAAAQPGLDEGAIAGITPFLGQAAVTVRNAQLYASATALADQMSEALTSRAVIEQAKGAIMATRRVTADAAFELLRRSSQRRNVKLRDVATEVVRSALPPRR